jgi:hypothetical protein
MSELLAGHISLVTIMISSSLTIYSFIRFRTHMAIFKNQIHPQRRNNYSYGSSFPKILRQSLGRLFHDTRGNTEQARGRKKIWVQLTMSTVWSGLLTNL